MAGPRATWKGILRISLVNIPVKVYPATESSESIAFNELHAVCQSRMQQRKWCPTCALEVPSADIVKGREVEAGKYVILSAKDFDQVRPASTKVIDITQIGSEKRLEFMMIERAYYLAPDGAGGDAGYAVMREGLRGQVAIGKLALYRREYLVAVHPWHDLLLLYTLHHDAELRHADDFDLELDTIGAPVKPAEVKLARQVLATFPPVNLAVFRDEYRVGLQAVIDSKVTGKETVASPTTDTPPHAPLLESLRKSLEAAAAKKRAPVRAGLSTKQKRA